MSIYVVTHKAASFPTSLPACYKCLAVGPQKDQFTGVFFRDDDGENIADLNSSFCELTGMYWIWKNRSDEIKGLCHYRRFFSHSFILKNSLHFLLEDEIKDILMHCDCIIPKKLYIRQNVELAYKTAHVSADWEILRNAVYTVTPEYYDSLIEVSRRKYFYYGNMFIATNEIFDSYCRWLFTILFEINKKINIQGRDQYQRRALGFLSERMLGVWLEKNKIKTMEYPVIETELPTKLLIKRYLEAKCHSRLPSAKEILDFLAF